jgi:plasmid maintenance system antidote protein VapI
MVSKAMVEEIEMMSAMDMSVEEIAVALDVTEQDVSEVLDKNIVEGD